MSTNNEVKVIAFYLPQFHPIPENDAWWGTGFTEWTSVGKAQKYYRGHIQPNVPADLGYYDLRLPEVRIAQAELAREAGVVAFCYWHYWFGDGKQLLEKPLEEVVRLGEPDFPFCLGWANHSWLNKSWNRERQTIIPKLLMEQKYLGVNDHIDHFYKMLPVFSDKRYYKVHGKLLFLVYDPFALPDFREFKKTWNLLATQNGLPEFFFIANLEDASKVSHPTIMEYDAISLCRLYAPWRIEGNKIYSFYRKVTRNISRLLNVSINKITYKKAIEYIDTPIYEHTNVYPNIIPRWDNSPRRGPGAYIYHNSTPTLFKRHVKMILRRVHRKQNEDKIVFLKSWNEWAEGNYMEPDTRWGKGYIQALKEALNEKY